MSRIRLPWLSRLALAFAIGVAGFGLAVDHLARRESEEHLRSDLESALQSHEAVLHAWASGLVAAVAEAAREPSLVAEARELATFHERAELLRAAPTLPHIRERLAPVTGDIRSTEFVIVDEDGFCIAASADDHLGGVLSPALRPWLARALGGETRITPPISFPVFSTPGEVSHLEPPTTALVSAPIVDAIDGARALLVFVVSLQPTLTRLLSTWQLESQRAETYAFDRDGHMISSSHYGDVLARTGLAGFEVAPGEPGLALRAPGGDVLVGYRPTSPAAGWPTIRPVAMALAGQPGFDVRGYRNYFGRWMVGAWKWLEPYGFGIVTERDREAVFRHHRVPRFAVSMASGIALASALAGLASSWVFARLARGADQAREVGPYQLVERLGLGAMGEVYLAQHALLRRPTAIKLIHSDRSGPRAARRFESEVATTASLSHPNTVAIYDYGRTTDGTLYFAMEYLRGFTVGKMVDRFGAIPESRTLLILTRVASALAEAHGIGFVHGDVSSQNVMLCHLGGMWDVVKLLDFGLARRADESKTRSDDIAGTPAFMAPEVFDQSLPPAPASDIYALGALGYYLVTGHAPFELVNPFAIYEAHLKKPVRPPSECAGRPIDPALERVLLDCLEKAPGRRPQDVSVVEARLRECRDFGTWTHGDARTWWSERADELLPKLTSFPSAEDDLAEARAKTVPLVRPARS